MGAKEESQARYDSANTKQFKMKLNLKTDADILAWLDAQCNKQGAVKLAIRKEIITMKYNDNEIKAMKKVLAEVGIETTDDNLIHNERFDYVTINEGRDDNTYAWYMDETKSVIVNVDTMESCDDEEMIRSLFC